MCTKQSYTNRASDVYIFIYSFIYMCTKKLQNGCKDPAENWQI